MTNLTENTEEITIKLTDQDENIVVKITDAARGPAGEGGGGSEIIVSDTQPTDPEDGLQWLNTTNGVTYTYVEALDVWISEAGIGDIEPPAPEPIVALGTVSVTNAADIKLDDIFDDALYDYYIYSLRVTPATDNVSLIARLRDGTPSTVATIRRCGGTFAAMTTTSQGTATTVGAVVGLIANTGATKANGIIRMCAAGHMITCDAHYHQTGGAVAIIRYMGDFNDSTPRQGILFDFSAGNVASGTLSIWGVLKQ